MANHPEPLHRPSPEAGFSLVDIMVALVIFAVGILAVGQLVIVSERHSDFGREETIAVSLAQEIKERIFTADFAEVKTLYDGVDTSDGETLTDATAEWSEHVADMFGVNGRGTIDVFDSIDDAGLADGLYRVEIVVQWQHGPKVNQVPLTFLMSKVGV